MVIGMMELFCADRALQYSIPVSYTHLYSENFSRLGIFETSLDDLVYREEANWTNYPKGVIWTFKEKGRCV